MKRVVTDSTNFEGLADLLKTPARGRATAATPKSSRKSFAGKVDLKADLKIINFEAK